MLSYRTKKWFSTQIFFSFFDTSNWISYMKFAAWWWMQAEHIRCHRLHQHSISYPKYNKNVVICNLPWSGAISHRSISFICYFFFCLSRNWPAKKTQINWPVTSPSKKKKISHYSIMWMNWAMKWKCYMKRCSRFRTILVYADILALCGLHFIINLFFDLCRQAKNRKWSQTTNTTRVNHRGVGGKYAKINHKSKSSINALWTD